MDGEAGWWTTSGNIGIPPLARVMGVGRQQHSIFSHDKMGVLEYNLHRDICIDESIVGFKGRHVLVNYIRIKKHHQWGPKEYNLADSSGYVHQTIYHIKGMGVLEYGQPYDVCDTLINHHVDKNHRLYVDNYYTSIPLCEKMLEKKIYVTGTVRANRKGLPPLINKKQTVKNALVAVRSEQFVLVWIRLICIILVLAYI